MNKHIEKSLTVSRAVLTVLRMVFAYRSPVFPLTGMIRTGTTGFVIIFICLSLHSSPVNGQKKRDTMELEDLKFAPRSKFLNNIFSDAMNSIKRNAADTIDMNIVLVAKSENSFKRYEGKIIRYIITNQFGFERTFADTTNRIAFFGTRILNALHTDTRDWVIRNNLFIRENSPIDPYKLADNERYLRTLDFIQDARIFIRPVKGTADSVDVMVITKDLFSLSTVLDFSVGSYKARIAENNFLGMAQKIQFTGLYEDHRTPRFGYDVQYGKNNIGGSFINGTIGYSQINTARSDGTEDEHAFYLRLDRPLVSPFSQFAGGAEISLNHSENVYKKPEILFYKYSYNIYDGWIGYNLGVKNIREDANYKKNRLRTFLSMRYMHTDFTESPLQVGDAFDPIYNDKQFLLGQVSLFKQDFYKLNYIYGFGTTEDVPQGFNVSVTAGWHKQLDLERPYAGFQADQYLVSPRGGFVHASFKTGAFLKNGKLQDASMLMSVNFFSRLFFISNFKMREYVKFSYATLQNRITNELLTINNVYGIHEFNKDSVRGAKRISCSGESVFFTNYKFLGFRFAPFIYAEASVVTPEKLALKKADIFTGVGGGLRTRNENLIFGTIEARFTYFPRTIYGLQSYKLMVSSDLRFRYRTNFVKAPDIVQLNREE